MRIGAATIRRFSESDWLTAGKTAYLAMELRRDTEPLEILNKLNLSKNRKGINMNATTDTKRLVNRVLMAVTPYQGASREHDAVQKFWMLLGLQQNLNDDVTFRKAFSFSLFDTEEVDFTESECQTKGSLAAIIDEFDLQRASIYISSLALTTLVATDVGSRIWQESIPTPSEAIEVYFHKKMFVFCTLHFRSGDAHFQTTEDWTLQVKDMFKPNNDQNIETAKKYSKCTQGETKKWTH